MGNVKGMSRFLLVVLLCLSVMCVFPFINSPTVTVYAENGIEDDIGGDSTSSKGGSGNIFDEIAGQELEDDDKGLSDWLKGQGGVNGENLETASNMMAPIVTLIGNVVGCIVVLIMALFSLITVLDLLYISVPPIRGLLYKGGAESGAVGMQGGYGRGMMGMNTASVNSNGKKPIQLISDEAIACASMTASASSSNTQMGVNGMNMQSQQGSKPVRSVIGIYFRKRLVFVVLLALCLVILTSSALMNCGINLADWGLKLIGAINGKLT